MTLYDALVAGKVRVDPIPGWETRRVNGNFKPAFIIIHHTAGTNSLNTIVKGRSDLPGPLSNLHITKTGTVNLVAAGRCNHAGPGSSVVLERTMSGYAPKGTAAEMGYADGPSGNGYSYGFECENLGDGRDPWPALQLQAMVGAAAAICRWHGWTANRVIGHLEWTRRKIDPKGFPMVAFRSLVADALKGAVPVPVHHPPTMESFMADMTPEMFVRLAYRMILRRPPSDNDVAAWAQAVRDQGQDAVWSFLETCPEGVAATAAERRHLGFPAA